MGGIKGGGGGEEEVAVDGEPLIQLTNQRKENGKKTSKRAGGGKGVGREGGVGKVGNGYFLFPRRSHQKQWELPPGEKVCRI